MMLDSAPPPAMMATAPTAVEAHDPGRVIWIGRMFPIKDPVLAVEAFALVAQRLPVARMSMFGTGSETLRVERKILELDLSQQIKLYGHVEWTTMTDHLDHARVLLITSLRESASAQMLEALARGVPIVGINQHGIGAFMPQDSGQLVEVADRNKVIADIASALESILNLSDQQWSEISIRARQAAVSMGWAEKAENLLGSFRKLANEATH